MVRDHVRIKYKVIIFFCIFFPDQMPKNRSRLLQMRYRNYLQYCKCYTFYFVIQLFSDPDKLEFKLSLLEQSVIAISLSRVCDKCVRISSWFSRWLFGSLYIYGKLPTYPTPKPTFCPKWEVSVNVGLGEGYSCRCAISRNV